MAKSVRASVSKRNSANLRKTVFGPADAARTKRLSAKLQELASQPKPNDSENSNEKSSAMKTDEQDKSTETKKPESSEGMDIDKGTGSSTKSRTNKSGRIQKRPRKHSIVFNSSVPKGKRGSKKLK